MSETVAPDRPTRTGVADPLERPVLDSRLDPMAMAEALIAGLDVLLSRQVNAIRNAPRFQEMEARWRGIYALIESIGPDRSVKLRLLDVSWQQLSRNLARTIDFDQSHVFELVYSQEFGMPGGEPFGLLIGDYAVSHRVDPERGDQVDTLRQIAEIAAAAFCPFVAGLAPDALGLDAFGELDQVFDMRGAFEGADGIRWSSLRDREDARFIGLVAPRMMLRQPTHLESSYRADGFVHREDQDKPLWINGAFAYAATAINQFIESGWFAESRGARQDDTGGGLVSSFTPLDYGMDTNELFHQPPIEVRLTSGQEQAMAELGLIPISTPYLMPALVFNSNQSLHRPKSFSDAQASQNARITAMLQYVLCAARFAHYLKVIMRDEIGSIADAPSLERRLNGWLLQYTIGNDDASQRLKAEYPLRHADVAVSALPGRPGAYGCRVHLQPHFQLDDVSTSFHLVADATELREAVG